MPTFAITWTVGIQALASLQTLVVISKLMFRHSPSWAGDGGPHMQLHVSAYCAIYSKKLGIRLFIQALPL